MRHLEAGRVRGKVAISIRHDRRRGRHVRRQHQATGRWPARRCWSPEAPAASGGRPPSAWPQMGAQVAITGRDRGAHRRTRPHEIRAAGGGQVDGSSRTCPRQAEVRRLADEVLQRLPADRRAGQQRRRLLEHPARHRRRARAHLRPQPPRAVPAHQPAARPAEAERPGPRGHRRVQRAGHGADRLRRPPGRAVLLRAGPTTSPSSPTSCSPTSWPDGCEGTAVTANALHPGVVQHVLRSRGPRPRSSDCSSRSCGRS